MLMGFRNLLVPLHIFDSEERADVDLLARMPNLLDTLVGEEHLLDFFLGEL